MGFNAEGGSRNFNFATRASHSSLGDYLTLVKGISRPTDGFFLRAESFFTVATEIEQLDRELAEEKLIVAYGGKSLHEQSHGESFLALMQHRFLGHGFYVLDEPEAALSPVRQLAFLRRLHQLVNTESQFVIATHSPLLLSYPNARIYEVSPAGFQPKEYEETEHYLVARDFLNDPQRMLALLFADL